MGRSMTLTAALTAAVKKANRTKALIVSKYTLTPFSFETQQAVETKTQQ
jgi:hypothetical protein